MDIFKSAKGFCPTQQKYYEVQVRYIDCSSHEDSVRRYAIGGGDCEFVRQGNHCEIECPLIKQMPVNI